MRCKKELISAYVDNELNSQEKNIICEHLKSCSSCRKEHKIMLKIGNILNRADEIQVSNNFEVRLWNEIKIKERLPKWLCVPIPSAIGMILIIIIIATTFVSVYAAKVDDYYIHNSMKRLCIDTFTLSSDAVKNCCCETIKGNLKNLIGINQLLNFINQCNILLCKCGCGKRPCICPLKRRS
jgi:predicted anti-sigma-YlaC factor YlaD